MNGGEGARYEYSAERMASLDMGNGCQCSLEPVDSEAMIAANATATALPLSRNISFARTIEYT